MKKHQLKNLIKEILESGIKITDDRHGDFTQTFENIEVEFGSKTHNYTIEVSFNTNTRSNLNNDVSYDVNDWFINKVIENNDDGSKSVVNNLPIQFHKQIRDQLEDRLKHFDVTEKF